MADQYQTRRIEEFYDKHVGQEIWIIGSGKSLDDFPSDFFEDKVSITLNGALFKYPKSTYWHAVHKVWFNKILAIDEEVLKRTISYYQIGENGKNIRMETDFLGGKKTEIIWFFLENAIIKDEEQVAETLLQIRERKERVNFCQQGTILHTGMEVAYLMGASKITLVGCENRTFGSLPQYATTLGIDYPEPIISWEDQKRPAPKITKWVANSLINFGIPTSRYYFISTEYYQQGYEKI